MPTVTISHNRLHDMLGHEHAALHSKRVAMKITDVSSIPIALATPDIGTMDSTQEALLVRVETDTGLVGWGECDHDAASAHAFLSGRAASSVGLGVRPLLLGRDPRNPRALADELYSTNLFSARRGIGLAILHAIDVCLWDIAAQARAEPLWQTLWGEHAQPPVPYATMYAGPGRYEQSLTRMGELLDIMLPDGYRSVKIEPLADSIPEARVAEFVAEGRQKIGDRELLVDVAYRYRTADAALEAIAEMADSKPTLLETPLPVDDLGEYRRLTSRSPLPIAAAELYESRWEFIALMDVGGVDVVQPWPNRLGITDSLSVIDAARTRKRKVILAGWNATPIGVAAGIHLAAGLGDGVSLEHAPASAYGFPLRAVATPDPVVVDGVFQLPSAPGLGVTIDETQLAKFTYH
jgi:L-alanine-DL-glutamate epimerase-like enolase superfamily enzyme